jgi:hypothetical protein
VVEVAKKAAKSGSAPVEELHDILARIVLLNGLDTEFEQLRRSIEVLATPPCFDDLLDLLERQLPQISEEVVDVTGGALVVSTKDSSPKVVCAHCKKPYHTIAQCFILHPELKKKKDKEHKKKVKAAKKVDETSSALMVNSGKHSKMLGTDFILDSGATNHYVTSKDL